MTTLHAAGSTHGIIRWRGVTLWLVFLLLVCAAPPARAAGLTWYVTSPNDSASDGDLATHSGSLRFALTHATSGDVVSFDHLNPAIVKIIAASTLSDTAHINRAGSSSQWSAAVQVLSQQTTALQLAPAALTFAAVPDGPPPPAQHLLVTPPSITPTLTWQTSVTTTDGLNWLSATPAMGSGSCELSVTANPAGLAPGTYHGSVSVADVDQPDDRATAAITLEVRLPLLSALGGVVDLSGPPDGPAHTGDLLRFSVVMTNVGAVDVTNINSTALQLSPGLAVVAGSGAIQGEGTGFVATDSGFSGGILAPGKRATYTLDAEVTADARPGMAIFSLEVNAGMVVSIPVVGRMRIIPGPRPSPQPAVWVPLVVR